MLEGLGKIDWSAVEHAYGPAEDVPGLLRNLVTGNDEVRQCALDKLYGNVFHQGTRYPATPLVVPFLIEMCSDPEVSDRPALLELWAHLITGYFNIQERPIWGDGELIHWHDGTAQKDLGDPISLALHDIYRESVKGHELLCRLLDNQDPDVRAYAAYVLACLPTLTELSVPRLTARLKFERWEKVRGAITFALGELGAVDELRVVMQDNDFLAARSMAACELARIQPGDDLFEPLLSALKPPLKNVEGIPGLHDKLFSDAVYSLTLLGRERLRDAVPAICELFTDANYHQASSLTYALLQAAYRRTTTPLASLDPLQRYTLRYIITAPQHWSALSLGLSQYGLSETKEGCAALLEL